MEAGTHRPLGLRTAASMLVGLAVAALGAGMVAEHDWGAAVVRPISVVAGDGASIAAAARQTGIGSIRPASPFSPLAGDEAAAVSAWQKVVDEAMASALASSQGFAVAGQGTTGAGTTQSASTSAAQAAAAAARNEALTRAATPPAATAPIGNSTPAAQAAAIARSEAAAQACPAFLASRARVITSYNEMVARFPNRMAQLLDQRDRALALIDMQLARFGCTLPSTGT